MVTNQLLQKGSVTWDLSHVGPRVTISPGVTNHHVTLPTLQQLINIHCVNVTHIIVNIEQV